MARIVVDQVFTEPFTDERYAEFAKKIDPCLEIRDGAWRRSYLSLDRLRLVCEFDARDAESVREAFRMAGLSYERIWSAEVFAVEDYPQMVVKLNEAVAKRAAT